MGEVQAAMWVDLGEETPEDNPQHLICLASDLFRSMFKSPKDCLSVFASEKETSQDNSRRLSRSDA